MAELFAAVDCGTNSVRLLVSRLEADGRLVELDRRLQLTRLGQGVDANGAFDPVALARTLDALADFGAQLDALKVPNRRVVATSAARDAADAAEFFTGARDRLGVEAEIISGAQEAWLSFSGAVAAFSGLARPVLVIDIGGGSTELVVGHGGELLSAISLDVGSVRVRERFLHSDPPTQTQISEASDYVNGLLDGSGIDFSEVATWVGVGGTVTSLSALVQGLNVYDRDAVHGSRIDRDELAAFAEQLLASSVEQVNQHPTMVPGRADVICAGALVCRLISDRLTVPLLVSEADILDGLIENLVQTWLASRDVS